MANTLAAQRRTVRPEPLAPGTRVVVRDLTIRLSNPRRVTRLGDAPGTVVERTAGVAGPNDSWLVPPTPRPARDAGGRYMVQLDGGHIVLAGDWEIDEA